MHDSTHRRSIPWIELLALFLLIVLGGSRAVRAQKNATASKTADISVFGGYIYSNPDYASFKNSGGTVGADYTRYFGWRIAPSFEVRANYDTGKVMTQESALAGLRLKMDIHRIHPYVDALAGGAKIVFKFPPTPGYTQDQAFSTSFGGGVDIDIVRTFQARIDYQQEFTNFGPNGTKVNNADFTLTPTLLTVGVVYRIPFRPLHR